MRKLIALIGVAIAVSSVAAGEANAWRARNFQTPTGNIVCHSVSGGWLGLMCTVYSAQRTIALPTYSDKAHDIGYRPLYAWRVLGYGSRWTWGYGHITLQLDEVQRPEVPDRLRTRNVACATGNPSLVVRGLLRMLCALMQ